MKKERSLYEEGKKSTRYFLNMEKQNYFNKVINSLRNNQNEVMHDAKFILNEQ